MFAAALLALAALNPLQGDFDHDGRHDSARIVQSGDQYVLQVTRGADPGHPVTLHRYGPRKPANAYVALARSGRFQTACGKGEGSDGAPCPHKWVTLRGGELSFGYEEAAQAVAVWNGRRFEVIWMTD